MSAPVGLHGKHGIGVNRKPVFAVSVHDHGGRTGELDLLGDGRPVRRVRDDLVAFFEERQCGVVERLLGAGGHDGFLRAELDAVVGVVAIADRLPQFHDPGGRRVLGEVVRDGVDAGRLDVFGRREVGFAGAEIDDIDTLAAEAIGFGRDAQRRRGRHTGHATG
jgi:hypothetical protein